GVQRKDGLFRKFGRSPKTLFHAFPSHPRHDRKLRLGQRSRVPRLLPDGFWRSGSILAFGKKGNLKSLFWLVDAELRRNKANLPERPACPQSTEPNPQRSCSSPPLKPISDRTHF